MEPISAAIIAALTAGAASGVAEELKATNASADPELLGAAHPEFGGTGVDPARELDRRLELEGPHSRWTARQRVSFHWGSLE